jgi:hypothetical protein
MPAAAWARATAGATEGDEAGHKGVYFWRHLFGDGLAGGDRAPVERAAAASEADTPPPRRILLTYAEGSARVLTAEGLAAAADRSGFFDEMWQCDRSVMHPDFVRRNAHILAQDRGCGYWLWKPYCVWAALAAARDGDVVVYLDSDYNLHDGAPLRSLECLVAAETNPAGIAAFHLPLDAEAQTDRVYTKADAVLLMESHWRAHPPRMPGGLTPTGAGSQGGGGGGGAERRRNMAATQQGNAALWAFRAGEHSRAFSEHYLGYAQDQRLLTDSPSTLVAEHPSFRDHRHDQSVASLLVKLWGLKQLPSPDNTLADGEMELLAESRCSLGRLFREGFTLEEEAEIKRARERKAEQAAKGKEAAAREAELLWHQQELEREQQAARHGAERARQLREARRGSSGGARRKAKTSRPAKTKTEESAFE